MGNQLFDVAYLPSPRECNVLMVELPIECTRYCYHQQKLGFVLAAMREHAARLALLGYRVIYRRLQQGETDAAYFARVVCDVANEYAPAKLQAFTATSRGQNHLLQQALEAGGYPVHWLEGPMFLTGFEQGQKLIDFNQPQMGRFYTAQRRRLGLLMESGKPRGGRWSFDEDNRRSLPDSQVLPEIPDCVHSQLTRTTLEEVAATFADNPGAADQLWLPTTREGALQWLERFIEERMIGFGSYEDALSQRGPVLFHSVLSPFLNIGLLTPDEVLEAVLRYDANNHVPLNDLEGFVRQLVGWREFVRLIYERFPDMRRKNCWNAHREMADSWHRGDTGIVPLDEAVRKLELYGWNHHIERLMVIANMHNLCEIRPESVYNFFMSRYIDAFDWVMGPNVFGMGLTSDGGTFATKPYIAGSNYMLKMGGYEKGPWCDVVDGLYWRFVDRHKQMLVHNPRAALMVRGLERLRPERRELIFTQAHNFLEQHTR